MSNIFERNIQALSLKDRALAEKILKHGITEVPQLVNQNGFYNLIYKNTALHNPKNPPGEAAEIFAQAHNAPVAIHVIYGIGLGYLFQLASSKSQGTVILYEPDLNILKTAFTLVDFSKDILKNNVFITDTFDGACGHLYKKSNTQNTPLLLSTSSYRELCGNKFNELVEELRRTVGTFGFDLKYTREKFLPLIKTIIKNIPQLIKEVPLDAIKGVYKGKTAVVVSAGPTLDRDINIIKKYRDNIILIVVGTAMKTLAGHGITPDFLCIIESFDASRQIAGLDLSNVNFVTEPYSNPNLKKFKFKKIYSHISQNMPLNLFWSGLTGLNTDEYISKGTVSYTALNTARILGCSKIILSGQDLAYIDGQCYSKDSAYKDLECRFNKENDRWEITAGDFEKFADAISNSPDENVRRKTAEKRLKNLNNSLYYVKGINGDKIPTESVYATFIKPLSEFAAKYNDAEYINTSMVGAQIDGFKNMPLEEALKDSQPVENREISTDFNFDTSLVKKNLDAELEKLKVISKEVNSGISMLKTLNNDIKRHRNVTVEVLKDLRKVSAMYMELSSSNSGTLFDYITSAERIDVDYAMKMSKDFNLNTVNSLSERFSKYFNNADKNMSEVTSLIKNTSGELS